MMIRSVGYALSWQYWRRGIYWFVPACAVLVVALMAPAYAVLTSYADVRAELNHAVFGVVCWGPLVMALASRGSLRRQYALPVETATLVGWTLANGALAVAITYWLVATGCNALFHAGWPLWGPAWWAVVVYGAFQGAVWAAAGARGGLLLPLVCLVLLAVFAGAPTLLQRVVPIASDTGAAPAWPTISAAELAVSLAVMAAFYLAAVYVVGRDRRGDAWSFAWLSPGWWKQETVGWVDGHRPGTVAKRWSALVGEPHRLSTELSWWGSLRSTHPTFLSAGTTAPNEFTPRPFRSPQAAQFWMEWRSKGRYVPLAMAAAIGLLWVIAALNRLDRDSVDAALGGLMSTFIVTSPLVGVYLGHRSERFDMRPFLATRPLADGDLAAVVLRHAAFAYGAGAIVWLIGAAVTFAVWVWVPQPAQPWPAWHDAASLLLPKVCALVGFLALVWTLVSAGAALAMARSWLVPVVGVGAGVVLLIVPFTAKLAPPPAAQVAMIALALGCLVGTVAAFLAAWRRKLVSVRAVIGGLAAYVLLLACWLVALGEGAVALEVLLLIFGLCAVPLAPLAAAPLALAWNRHS